MIGCSSLFYLVLTETPRQYTIVQNDEKKVVIFERGALYWVFNFHAHQSYPDFRVGVTHPGKYKIVLDTDSAEFGGHSRVQKDTTFFTDPTPWDDRPHSMLVHPFHAPFCFFQPFIPCPSHRCTPHAGQHWC